RFLVVFPYPNLHPAAHGACLATFTEIALDRTQTGHGGNAMSEALKAFEEELQSKNFKGYWQNQQGDVYREPVPSFEACFWKGKDLFAAMEKAGDVVGLDVSFRRVIQLWNPALKNGTSRTLVLNLQLLKPGENAGS